MSSMQGLRLGASAAKAASAHRAAAAVQADERVRANHRHLVKLEGPPLLRWVGIRGVSSRAGSILLTPELTLLVPDSNTIFFPSAARAAPAHSRVDCTCRSPQKCGQAYCVRLSGRARKFSRGDAPQEKSLLTLRRQQDGLLRRNESPASLRRAQGSPRVIARRFANDAPGGGEKSPRIIFQKRFRPT